MTMTHNPDLIFDADEIAIFPDCVAVAMPEGQPEPTTGMHLISAVLRRLAAITDAEKADEDDPCDLLEAVLGLVELNFIRTIGGRATERGIQVADFGFNRDHIRALRVHRQEVGVDIFDLHKPGEETAIGGSNLPFHISPVFEILRQAGEFSHFIETFMKMIMGIGQLMGEEENEEDPGPQEGEAEL